MCFNDIKPHIFVNEASMRINDIQSVIEKLINKNKRHKHVRRIDINKIKIETSNQDAHKRL